MKRLAERISGSRSAGLQVVRVEHRCREITDQNPIHYRVPAHGITLFIEGSARIRQGGVEFPSTRPLFWYLPTHTEAFEHVLAGPFHNMFATFRLPELRVIPERKAMLRVTWNFRTVIVPRWKIPDSDAVTRITDLFVRLKAASESPKLSGSIRAASLMLELFSLFLELPDGKPDQMGHRALARVQHELQTNMRHDASLSELAGKAGVSEGYLRRLFRDHVGLSPLKYRNNLRITRARDILVSGDVSVKEAAVQVGFDDPLYFSRLFHKHFGLSPRELIRRNRLPQISGD